LPLPEKALIRRIRSQISASSKVKIGIGDDCAVLRIPPEHELLVTTDFCLEDIHFRRKWHPADVVGHRCLTRGLSDIAAMGGEPIAAFLSLALPARTPQKWVDGFMKGLLRLAEEFNVPLAGGDTAQSPDKILADIVVVGSVPKQKAVLRSGARPGDLIYVTGELGGASAALGFLRSGKKLSASEFPRHFHPLPRVKGGRFLRERGLASAMIDASDGLSTDLGHICEESGVGAEIEASAIPRSRIGRFAAPVDLNHALHGGEDYELIFTARPGAKISSKISGVAITKIGKITRGKKIFLTGLGRRSILKPQGWQHFQT
jgi:thiamine-monophosphate kinase